MKWNIHNCVRIFLLLLFVLTMISADGQDVMFKRDDQFMLVNISKIKQDSIYFKKYRDSKDSVYVLPESEVEMIFYANGETKKFESGIAIVSSHTDRSKDRHSLEYFQLGMTDAANTYDGYHHASNTILLAGSILTPFITVIPAAICSNTPPKEISLNYRNAELNMQPAYKEGYRLMAHKIKKKQVWRSWDYSVAISFSLIVVFSVLHKSGH